MTRAQLSALVVSWLDDAQQGYFTPTNVNTWLNLAQRQVQMMLLQAGENWYQKAVETQTVIGQSDYLLPVDFMVEHKLELVVSGTGVNEQTRVLSCVTTNEFSSFSKSLGTPSVYTIKKDRFSLRETPSQQLTMRLFYSPMVADLLLDSDSPDVPEQFMEFVAILAAYDGFIKDDRAPENLLLKKQAYEALLKQMAEDRTQDASRRVVQTSDFDSGGIY